MSNKQLTIKQDFAPVLDQLKPNFEKLTESAKINFEQEKMHALTLLGRNDYLAKIARSNKGSLAGALLQSATLGLTLNPAMKLSYLVPRDGQVVFEPSYMGLMELMYRAGIRKVVCELVYSNDYFKYNASESMVEHDFDCFAPLLDRGEFRGGYVVVTMQNSEKLPVVLSAEKIEKIKNRSIAVQRGQYSAWTSDEDEMRKKTIIRAAFKLLPKSEKLAAAIEYIEKTDGIDFEKEKELIEQRFKEEGEKRRLEYEELQEARLALGEILEARMSEMTASEKQKCMVAMGIKSMAHISMLTRDQIEDINNKLQGE